MIKIPKIDTFNLRIQEGDLIKGMKEMKKLLANAEKPQYAYKGNRVNNKVKSK